jgi:hypothetical protein
MRGVRKCELEDEERIWQVGGKLYGMAEKCAEMKLSKIGAEYENVKECLENRKKSEIIGELRSRGRNDEF